MTNVTQTLRATCDDLSFAARVLVRSRGFAAGAVSIVALCLSLNIAIFSVINAVFLRALPVPAPEELAFVYSESESRPMLGGYRDALRLGADRQAFANATLVRSGTYKVRVGLEAHYVFEEAVTSSYFDVLRLPVQHGQLLKSL
jgi:hypothetical protein